MATINAKTFEPKFNEQLSKLIYATFDDIGRDWNAELKHSPMLFVTYATLLLDKKLRPEGLKNRFTISTEVKQMLTKLYSKMAEEFQNIRMGEGDTAQTIIQKLKDGNTECYSAFMFELGEKYKHLFGEKLKNASDPALWFHNQIVGFLKAYAGQAVLVATVSQLFENFLKALAWLFAKLLWYYEVSISDKLFLGTLAQQGVEQVMLDEIQSGLRAKPPAKPRTKKLGTGNAVAPETVAAAAKADPVDDAPEDAADDAPEDDDDKNVDVDEIANILHNM